MKVNEIFFSVQGEGLLVGAPTLFVRFQGCNLGCAWCDTPYAQSEGEETTWSASASSLLGRMSEVEPAAKHICLTGGEPMEQPRDELVELVEMLNHRNMVKTVSLETNGAYSLQGLKHLRQGPYGKLRFVVDYKLPSSEVEDRMVRSNFQVAIHPTDCLKFVCADPDDFTAALAALSSWAGHSSFNPTVIFQPVWGEMHPKMLTELVLQERGVIGRLSVRVNVQLHKVIWGPGKRGV